MPDTPWFYVESRTGKNAYRRHPLDGDLLVVEEQHDLRIVVQVDDHSDPPQATLDARRLPWNEDESAFVLEGNAISHWVGTAELRLSHGTRSRALQLEVVPKKKKTTPEAWLRMLRQIDAWMPGITVGHDAGRHGQVGEHGVSAPLLAEALTPLLPLFAQALHEIERLPRTSEHLGYRDTPLSNVRQDRASAHWLSRRPQVLARAHADDPAGPQPLVPQRLGVRRLEHPANRYIAHLTDRTIKELTRVRDRLGELAQRYATQQRLNDTGDWCRARAERLTVHLDELRRLWRGSFLRRLPHQRSPGSALGVIIDHPSYARAHKLGRLLVSPRFRLPEDDAPTPEDMGPAPVRASFELYELWTFLFVQRSLAERLSAPAWTWREYNLRRLADAVGTGEGARFEARGPEDTVVEILFNEAFPSCPHNALGEPDAASSDTAARCFSLLQARRPNTVVRWRRPGHEGRWVYLSAMYVEPDELSKPMQALHTYRDALWMDGYGGRCCAGLLLAPAASPGSPWLEPGFRDRFDLGVWPSEPGAAPDLALADWLLSRLRD
ncbi:hypothetical protein [Haliangium ochraceum]|uniref:DUF2357 domain-containing protein n=1 Tax=Haliangium ochraceum (strain DSM 14365 / JCM 11303 / SMP-2) TaxID=502025 RepID=D0LTI9_HALO1|nr:hypothetical protein [Haliangium ochraceum]ACY13884.1 conserved hypothetical protein [Haliangium ochraceum DSM 14365]